jgi:hypothetical protein
VENAQNREESAKAENELQKCAKERRWIKPTYALTWTEAPTWRRS